MHTLHRFLWVVFFGTLGCSSVSRESIVIYRDDFGVPNIFARTDAGVAFGMGYAQAEDRLEELLKQFRRATGTMAEVFGPEHFRDDYRQRVWRHAEVSRERYGELSPRVRSILEAYVEGVKRFQRCHPERSPSWAGEVEPWMLVALGRYVIWGWPEGTAAEDLERGGIQPDPVEPHASNEWVVSGSRTASGAPMALIDPHLSWYGAFRFYEARLYGDRLQVAGVSILGSPIPTLGHNRRLSVAMTTGGPDTSDAYEIELDPAHPGQYRFDGAWREIRVVKDVIRVKQPAGVQDVAIEIQYTHHGPIVAHRDGKAYAMRIPYMDQVGLLEQTYDMMTAGNVAEMKSALRQLQLMEQNVMVATVDGDIFYLRNGRVPIRPAGFDWSRPVPGNTSKTEWLGIHSIEDLVQTLNPPSGYMQNCNVSPAWMMVDSPLTLENFAERPYLYNAENPFLHPRAAEVRAELHAEPRLTLERAMEIAQSTTVFGAERWQSMLDEARHEPGSTAKLALPASRVADLIAAWNRRADIDSTGATAYYFWKRELFAIAGEPAREADKRGLHPPTIPATAILGALEAAATKLRNDWGKVEVPFGDVFRIQRQGSSRSFPLGGGSLEGMATPRAVSFRSSADKKTQVGVGGQTATQIVVLSDPPESYSLLPLGESDDAASPHFDDQAEKLMSPRKLKPTYFLRKDELLRHVTSTLQLER